MELEFVFQIQWHSTFSISLQTKNVNVMVLEDKTGDHLSYKDSSSENHECIYKIVWQSTQ